MRTGLAVLCLLLAFAAAPAPATVLLVERRDPALPEAGIDALRAETGGWIGAGPAIRRADGSRWWRLRLDAGGASGDWVVSLREAYDARLVAYLPPDYAPRPLHTFDPDLEQIGSRHRLALHLPAEAVGQPVYIAVDWARSQPIGLAAEPLAEYVAGDLGRVRYTSAMVAAMLLLAVVGAIYAFALRRRMLLLFCLWVVSSALYQLVLTGEVAWLMGEAMRQVPPMGVAGVITNLGLLAAYVFVYSFLEVGRNFPRLARLYRGLLYVVAALVVAMLASSASPGVSQVLNLTLLLLAGLAMGLSFVLALRGGVQARFYLLGWGVVAVGSMLRAYYFLNLLGTPVWLEYAHPALNAVGALVLVLATARAARYAEREMHSARQSARTDPLTGLPNRAELDLGLPGLVASAQARGHALSVMFIDLDHFKRVNDTWGHGVGDLCLTALARVLRRYVRASDLVARYGGEEFVLVLEGADAAGAGVVASSLRAMVESEGREVAGRRIGLTVSVGIASLRPGECAAELLKRADEALYRAKDGGRNRVVLAPGEGLGPPLKESTA